MRCPICDFENPMHSTTCARCGSFLPEETAETSKHRDSILDTAADERIRCSYCWKLNSLGASLCEECGMPLAYVPNPDPKRKPRRLKKRGEQWEPVPEGMVRCRSCWYDNPEEASICEKCGSKLVKSSDLPDCDTIRSYRYEPPNGAWRRFVNHVEEASCGLRSEPRPKSNDGPIWDIIDVVAEKLRPEEERRKIEESKNRSRINKRPPGTIRCRNCWHDNPEDAEVCGKCGNRLPKS